MKAIERFEREAAALYARDAALAAADRAHAEACGAAQAAHDAACPELLRGRYAAMLAAYNAEVT